MFFLNQYVGIEISNSFEVISHMELTAGKFFYQIFTTLLCLTFNKKLVYAQKGYYMRLVLNIIIITCSMMINVALME